MTAFKEARTKFKTADDFNDEYAKQEAKEETTKAEQVKEELSDDDLEGLNGGIKFSQTYIV